MRSHTKIYFKISGIDPYGFVPCEVTGAKCNDIHHIDCKGMGGDPTGSKDVFENLMAVTREVHEEYGDKKHHMEFLYRKHVEAFPWLLEFDEETGKAVMKK